MSERMRRWWENKAFTLTRRLTARVFYVGKSEKVLFTQSVEDLLDIGGHIADYKRKREEILVSHLENQLRLHTTGILT
jgi:hypothetical protein